MAKDILKEAIADAKAVREVALANAKAALEEAFTPKLQSMLSAKLSEELKDDEEIEENVTEETTIDEIDDIEEVVGMDTDEQLDEEIDLEEILNELELEEGEVSNEDTIDEVKDEDEEEAIEELNSPAQSHDEVANVLVTADMVHEGGEFDLDALLEEINSLDENDEDDEDVKEVKVKKEAVNPLANELKETQAALSTVQNELNEVNLLNSKLLYVNRIFKVNTLDDAQKLRVVETLDKAETAKEAKLIYETIKDTFTISKGKKTTPQRSIREGLGMASKAAGTSTAPKKAVLNESNDMVARMQKLANITIKQ